MEVYFVVFVGVAEFLASFGTGISAVIETIAEPVGTGEFCPLYVVGQKFFGLVVHHIYFCPVGTGAGNCICGVLAVFALAQASKRDGAVVAEGIGVEEYFTLAVGSCGTEDDRLIVLTVVGGPVPHSVLTLPGGTAAAVSVEAVETVVESLTERNLREILVGEFVFSFHPFEGCGGGVVFKRTVSIAHGHAEGFVGCAVAWRGRIL